MMTERKYDKVFGIGQPKTGTKTLGKSFELLGFSHRSWDPNLLDLLKQEKLDAIFQVADAFESFEDLPWSSSRLFPLLDRRYPGSKFILTVRSEDEWIRSYERHFAETGDRTIPERHLIRDFEAKKPQILQEYRQTNELVRHYFESRPFDLLIMNICAGEGWEKLCPFLEVLCPSVNFPFENKTEDRIRKKLEND